MRFLEWRGESKIKIEETIDLDTVNLLVALVRKRDRDYSNDKIYGDIALFALLNNELIFVERHISMNRSLLAIGKSFLFQNRRCDTSLIIDQIVLGLENSSR